MTSEGVAVIDVAGRLTTPGGRVYRTWGVTRIGGTDGGADVRWWEPIILPPPYGGLREYRAAAARLSIGRPQ